MAIRTGDGKFKCSYCGTKYSSITEADSCRESHNLIYIALTRTDLNRLINFIYTKNDELLSRTLIETLRSYLRGS